MWMGFSLRGPNSENPPPPPHVKPGRTKMTMAKVLPTPWGARFGDKDAAWQHPSNTLKSHDGLRCKDWGWRL